MRGVKFTRRTFLNITTRKILRRHSSHALKYGDFWREKINKKRGVIIVLFLLVLLIAQSLLIFAHDVDTPDHPVHQYISKEAIYAWNLTPIEIKQNIEKRSYTRDIDTGSYNSGENILTGSGEEDTQLVANCLAEVIEAILFYDPYLGYEAAKQLAKPFCYHFWDPDNPVDEVHRNN